MGTVRLQLSGSWRLTQPLPAAADVERQLEARGDLRRVVFEAQGVSDWDSGLLTFLRRLDGFVRRAGLAGGMLAVS